FFAGWIHFRLLIRFNRLKKKIFTDVEGRIISGSGRCFNTIWRMNKNKDRRASFRRHSRAGGSPDLGTTAIFKDYLKVRDSRFPLSRE
ncbi:TPA: hypothetical protein ACM5W6_001733, partial [Neisseria gonorrhoeae]